MIPSPTTQHVKVTIIIPSLNEEAHIEDCVATAWDAKCDEVIVADGGSSDRTLEIVRSLACRVVQTEVGRSRQQNAAAQQSTGDVLVFLHADNCLAPDACEQIRKALRNDTAVWGAFRQRIQAPGACFRAIERGNALRVSWLGLPYGDQGMFIRRNTFFDVGGFPPTHFLEDLLLAKRLRRVGWPRLLQGPILVSARRWLQHGTVRQTLRNWSLLAKYSLGVPPDRLAEYYERQ